MTLAAAPPAKTRAAERDTRWVPASQPVRVLVVSRPSQAWGAQLRLLSTAPALSERGVEFTLCVPPGNPLASRWEAAGLPLVAARGPQPGRLRRPDGRRIGPLSLLAQIPMTVVAAARLAALARRHDVVLSYSRHAHVEAVLAGALARRPVVVEVVDIVVPGIGRRLLSLAATRASAVVANSRATAASLGRAAQGAHVIHPAVDSDRFRPGPADPAVRERLGGRPGEPLIAVLGRLDEGKRIELVVDAVASAAEGVRPHLARAVLTVVGDRGVASTEYVERLKARARSRLGDRVAFPGRVEDVPSALRAIDVLVNASDAEPFGRSVLEAQATGTPVVVAAGGGIPEFVEDGRTGRSFAPGDAAGLADALEDVLGDHARTAALARAAREQAVARFRPDDRHDRLADLYRAVSGERRR